VLVPGVIAIAIGVRRRVVLWIMESRRGSGAAYRLLRERRYWLY
jgi:hypothetical protein